jgi:hypothetical protein
VEPPASKQGGGVFLCDGLLVQFVRAELEF